MDRAGEIAQPLRSLAALPEDQGWTPNIHMVDYNSLFQEQGIWRLLLASWHMWHKNINTGKTPIHINKQTK